MKIAELGRGRQEGVPRGITRCQWYMSSTPEINETTRATPGSTAISQRQAEALEIVRAHRRRTGVAPTRALLREAMELRKNSSVERHLNGLSRRGWLEVMPNVDIDDPDIAGTGRPEDVHARRGGRGTNPRAPQHRIRGSSRGSARAWEGQERVRTWMVTPQ